MQPSVHCIVDLRLNVDLDPAVQEAASSSTPVTTLNNTCSNINMNRVLDLYHKIWQYYTQKENFLNISKYNGRLADL